MTKKVVNVRLPNGTGWSRNGLEFWYDRSLKLWTLWDPVTTEVIGYEHSKPYAERMIDSYADALAKLGRVQK